MNRPLSPRIDELFEQIEEGGTIATDAFWAEMADRTTPLIEPDPADDGVKLVTFLWRETGPTTNVLLIEWMTPGDLPDKAMTHLPGTDIWYRTLRIRSDVRSVYRFSPNDSLVPRRQEEDWTTRRRNWRLDPLNPNEFLKGAELTEDDRLWFHSSIVELPDARNQPDYQPLSPDLTGVVERHRFRSSILDNERDIWVHRPGSAIAKPDEPLALFIHFDGERCLPIMTIPEMLDSLHSEKKIAPTLAVMIGNVDRGNELPCNPLFAKALAEELVPWLRERYPISHDPSDVTLAGQSYGGLAALYCAFRQPETFGNVLSQSGSFWWKPNPHDSLVIDVIGDAPNYEWLNGEVASQPAAPIRIFMEAGLLENRTGADGAPSLLQSNRHMRNILIAKGYDLIYREYSGDHDYIAWRVGLPEGLIALSSLSNRMCHTE